MKEVKPNSRLRERLKAYHRMKPLIAIKEFFVITFCTLPYAMAVNQVLVPHDIVGGGVTGLCEIIYFATMGLFPGLFTGTMAADGVMVGVGAIPIWLSSATLNIGLLLAALFTIGPHYTLRTAYGVLWLTVWLKVVPVAAHPLITDPFMAVILGGLCVGCFLGLCFLNNGSTGGTDIIAMIINKYYHFPLGKMLMSCDMIIIASAFFLPNIQEAGTQGAVEKILFGLCYTFMLSTAVDWVMNRMRQSVQFFIFSNKADDIAEAIMTQVDRGCTILEAKGGYSKKPMKVITTIARQHESAIIFRVVRAIDPEAFVSQSQVRGVFGQGFESIKEKA